MSKQNTDTHSLPIALVGGGGHTKSLCLAGFDVEFVGYVDCAEVENLPLKYLGDDKTFLAGSSPEDIAVHIAVVSGRDCSMALRRKIIERYDKYRFARLIASSALLLGNTSIGDGTVVMHRCVVNGATLGSCCVVNTGAIIEHDVVIGDNVFVGPGAVICGAVSIGDDCYIGAGSVIRNGVSITSGVTIGMGSVLVADIDIPGVYVGNPCRRIK